MGKLGYAACGIGEKDVALGYEEFRKRTAGVRFPLVSTNIVRKDNGEPAFKPWAVVEAPRGGGKAPIRVGVLSVVRFNPMFMKAGPEGTNLSIAPAAKMVARYLDEVRKSSDVVVLLAAMSRDDARDLVKQFPGIDLVAGAYGGVYTTQEEAEGRTPLAYVQNQGKKIGETRFFLDASNKIRSTESWMYSLTAKYPDDPEVFKFVAESLAKLPGAPPSSAGAASPAAARPAAPSKP